jgi:tetraacyldisaccharide 4'-kinase
VIRPSEFRELVSGQRRGFKAGLMRAGLRVAETPYGLAMRARNLWYDLGRSTTRVEAKIVSVGNLTLGGTGKTPMVEWLARWFRKHGMRVAIVSRGYGAEEGVLNDEALELEQKLPDVPHLQNADRVAGARMAIEEFASQVILLDDAFQHRRIVRDLDIVLLDALEPFGLGHVFPRGMLREPLAGLRRAQVVALSRADMLPRDQRDEVRDVVRRYAPKADWLELEHDPSNLLSADLHPADLNSLVGFPVAAFCGVGNPAGFRHTLEDCGYEVKGFREFPDHYAYQRHDVESLTEWIQSLNVHAVVCTHKDLVKLGVAQLGKRPLWAVAVGIEFLAGQGELEGRLRGLVEE